METTLYPGIPFSPQATLTNNIGAADSIIEVSDVSAFPPAPNLATIGTDEEGETILYTAKTETALSGCQRGVEGAARTWTAGELIGRNFTAKDHADLIAAVTETRDAATDAAGAALTAGTAAKDAQEAAQAAQEAATAAQGEAATAAETAEKAAQDAEQAQKNAQTAADAAATAQGAAEMAGTAAASASPAASIAQAAAEEALEIAGVAGDMHTSVYDPQGKAQDIFAYAAELVEGKQDKVTGQAGQVAGFDADGNLIPQAAPETGVTSFNGRTGAVAPEDGDYSVEQITRSAGRSMAEQTVEPTQGNTVTAGASAEIFNDYSARQYDADGRPSQGNIASGIRSHAEGLATTATGMNSHAEGYLGIASGSASHVEGGAFAGQNGNKASGYAAHAEGSSTEASGGESHAEGSQTIASGTYGAHAEGNRTIASGTCSHAEGCQTTAAGQAHHAEGLNTKTSGEFSGTHAEGYFTTADGQGAHAEGEQSSASGSAAHAEGLATEASGEYSHAGGCRTIAAALAQTAIGSLNKSSQEISDRFIVGKGTSETSRANCFRVTDTGVYATGAHYSSGADYAELFEWLDSNPDKEDRCGRFVTLDGEKIRLAGPEDDYILGIVSGNPSVVGDVHDDQWAGMYLYDIFGRPIWEDVEVPEETMERPDPEDPEKTIVEVIRPAHTERRQKLNPDYDNTQPYLPRTQRPEWDAVGMLGKLVTVDDGTCRVNGWCTVGEGGIAVHSAERTRFRVMARLDERHVKVLIMQ